MLVSYLRHRSMLALGLKWAVGTVLVLSLGMTLSACLVDAISRDLVGPYRLLAVDEPENLALTYDPDGSGGFLRVGPTVVQVGWNDRYLVAAERPFKEPGGDLRYYYIDMTKDHEGGFSEDEGIVFGPFKEEEFKSLRAEMNLPEFTVHYPELR